MLTLVGLVEEILCDGDQRTCLIVSASVERFHGDARVRKSVRATTNSLEDAFTEVIGGGQARGELSSPADPRDLARFLIATIHAAVEWPVPSIPTGAG